MATPHIIDLTGKVAVVTGGSRGLGRAMVLGFAGAGADVVIASRKLDACETLAQEVRALGRRALPLALHVGDWDALEPFVDAVYAEFGRIDVFVNNAGMSPVAPSSVETTEALFDKVIDVNLKGPFRLTALVGSRMAQAGSGSIINVSSVGALRPSPWVAPYAAAKAGLNAMSAALSQEWSRAGVRVNVLSPGPFLTDVSALWAADEKLKARVSLGRFGEPEEVVSTALYLATATFTNGTNVVVDGGPTMFEPTS